MAQYKGRIGFGDGSNRVYLLPETGATFLTVYVNGAELYEGIEYDILVGAGERGMDIIAFRVAPASGLPIEIEWTDHTGYVHTVESLRISMGTQA